MHVTYTPVFTYQGTEWHGAGAGVQGASGGAVWRPPAREVPLPLQPSGRPQQLLHQVLGGMGVTCVLEFLGCRGSRKEWGAICFH